MGCPSCGAPTEVDEKFCGGCGAALTIGGEKIRQPKATVEGERKQVTVLFARVRIATPPPTCAFKSAVAIGSTRRPPQAGIELVDADEAHGPFGRWDRPQHDLAMALLRSDHDPPSP